MKKYSFLYILLFACYAKTSFAQLQVNKQFNKKEPFLHIQMVHITPVESLFMPVHIDTLKRFAVSLKPIVFEKQENAACAHFKSLKETLVLSAERASNIMANLQWETKYAFYATGFTIESSLGDSLHFVTVNSVPVSNATSFKINYHLPNHNDYSGLSFYRIKQHNGNTSFVYSNIVSIKGYDITPFKIYPIPASNKVWIDVVPNQSGNLTIVVYDLTGKITERQFFSCTANMHVTPGINISKLAPGVYQLKVFMPDKSFLTGEFIKQ
jgi:hypothetical protein